MRSVQWHTVAVCKHGAPETVAGGWPRSCLALLLLGVLHLLILSVILVVRIVVVIILRLADEPQGCERVAATPLKAPRVLHSDAQHSGCRQQDTAIASTT